MRRAASGRQLSCDAIAIARPRFNVDDMRDLGAVLDHKGAAACDMPQ